MVREGIPKENRFMMMQKEAKQQLSSLNNANFVKSLKFTSTTTYQIPENSDNLSEFNKKLKEGLNHNPKQDD